VGEIRYDCALSNELDNMGELTMIGRSGFGKEKSETLSGMTSLAYQALVLTSTTGLSDKEIENKVTTLVKTEI